MSEMSTDTVAATKNRPPNRCHKAGDVDFIEADQKEEDEDADA